jgi:hypothetical protein
LTTGSGTARQASTSCVELGAVLQYNTAIQEIQWPEFQQDKEIVPAIKECLEQRKS